MESSPNDTSNILIELRHVKKEYAIGKQFYTALDDINLCLPKTGMVAILGPSGSGKTTLLNIIGGLDRFQEGDLIIGGVSTKDFKSSDWDSYRNHHVGFIFQSYNLVQTYNLEKNIALPLSFRGAKTEERKKRSRDSLEQVGLEEDTKKRPSQLSGGQQQRVAIARALAGNPSLLLCDEPTGALDSKSSENCMKLLKDLSKDRLVVIVTHNQALADKYADRIIGIEDGKIASDSKPLLPNGENVGHGEPLRKVRMGFFSAVATGAKNILLKKGRNIVTMIACSIGIIGVCLVLGASNGFQNYVNTVETSVGSSVPITISPSSYQSKSNNTDKYDTAAEFPTDDKIHVYDTSYSTYVAHTNKFSKEYIDYLDQILTNPSCPAYKKAMSILYNRSGLDFHFLTEKGDSGTIMAVDANRSAGNLGSMLSSYANIPGSIIHELYGDDNLLDKYYSVIKGKLPEKADEMVLVVDRYNRVDFTTLRYLGVFSETNYSQLSEAKKLIDFDDLLYSGDGDTKFKEYKCYRNSDYFDLSKPFTVIRNAYEDVELSGELGFNPSDPKTFDKLHVTGTPVQKECVVYPGPFSIDRFYKEDHNAISCKIVGILRPTEESYLTLMPTSLAYRSELKDLMVGDYQTKSKALAEAQENNWFLNRDVDIVDGEEYQNPDDGLRKMNEALARLASQFSEESANLDDLVSTSSVLLFNDAITSIRAGSAATASDGTVISYYHTNSASTYLSWCHMFGVEVPQTKISSLSDLLAMYLSGNFFSSEAKNNIMNVFAYMNAYSLISSISIFPSSLTAKAALKEYLDAWNEGKEDVDTIVYSDFVSELTDSIGQVIALVSVVMVIFASISLLVSSVMTAVISYVSVIERKKEIGVLRACGARKRDVGRLFETENALLGFASGALAILVAFAISIPVNFIVNDLYPSANLKNIVSIHPLHVVVLIGLSVILALIAGFVPSRIAARKDPVECLRSE